MYETNPPLDEVYNFYTMSEDEFYDEENLTHYGMPRRSGRYPWGSGENPYQHSADFMARVQSLKKSNATAVDESTGEILTGERAIAKIMGLANTKELRVQYALAKDEKRTYDVQRARSLRDDGKSLNAKEFVERWATENGSFGVEKVIQGARTESVPLGELKKLAEERILYFDEELMKFAMGNCIIIEDTNGNRKLSKKRYDQKIDAVAAMMDAYVAYKLNIDAFE